MKTIQYHSTLFYYDGPQVIEARDEIGGHYVAVLNANHENFVVVGAAPRSLDSFRAGSLDLRSLLLERGSDEWFLADPSGIDGTLSLVLQASPLAESDSLPEPGFVLDEAAASEVVNEARNRNNFVLEVAVSPPEAREEHRIRADTLAGLLAHLQTLIKHGYAAARRELTPATRRRIDVSDAHLLNVVVPAATGSFRIVLEGAKRPDMFGQSELARAMAPIDDLFEEVTNIQRAVAKIKANPGHLAAAYLRLLRFLRAQKSGMNYSWAEPTTLHVQSRSVSEEETGVLVDALSEIANLGVESIDFIGILEKADANSGEWRLNTERGKFAGRVKPGGASLEGLKIGGKYQFHCNEEIEEFRGFGRERHSLYLVNWD